VFPSGPFAGRATNVWHFGQCRSSVFECLTPFVLSQVHFILRHRNPDGEIEEKHLSSPPLVEQDKLTHVYTAILKPDNTCVFFCTCPTGLLPLPLRISLFVCFCSLLFSSFTYFVVCGGELFTLHWVNGVLPFLRSRMFRREGKKQEACF
jgi:Calreticulin family